MLQFELAQQAKGVRFDVAFLMTRWTKLWIAVAAFTITALLTVAAGEVVSLVMRVLFADQEKWWWPLLMNGLASTGVLLTIFLPVGLALYVAHLQRGRRERFPHLAGLGRLPR